jgi:transposase
MKRRDCPGCRLLRQRVAELEALVRQLQARLDQNASNSSLPPSANPPDAPKPVVKGPTGRQPGGQPGHAPCARVRLPAERLQQVVRHVPTHCRGCQQPLPPEPQAHDPEPTWHQVAELPPTLAHVTEHQGHSRTCPHCGTLTHQPIPAAVRAHAFGPRLTAALAYLAGGRHDSKRGVEETVETLFGVPIALGSIARAEQEVSAALAPAHAEVAAAVRQAPVKHADETSWKQAGRLCWLWTAVTAQVAFFTIHARRGLAGLAALLGEAFGGILVTDRWSAYQQVPVRRRQVCWAHLVRDFRAASERGGRAGAWGEELRCCAEELFHWWHRVRDGTLAWATFRGKMRELRSHVRRELRAGCGLGCAKTAGLCRKLLAVEPALWTFARLREVEPTNNRAERALRPAVLWRKGSFGCHSAAGCRYVERMLTVTQTLRLQKRGVLDYLRQAIDALRHRQPCPALLTNG